MYPTYWYGHLYKHLNISLYKWIKRVLGLNKNALAEEKRRLEQRVAALEEEHEDAKKGLLRQIRELESEVEVERKQRGAAVNARKKLKADLSESAQQLDFERKFYEEQSKQMQVCSSCYIIPSIQQAMIMYTFKLMSSSLSKSNFYNITKRFFKLDSK